MSSNPSISLQNIENYINTINNPISEIFARYVTVLTEYVKQITDNVFIQNSGRNKYIIEKGVDIIAHVFNILFLYTKNLDLTVYHCQKSLYYYVEFIGQLGDMHKILQLSSKDSALFIYKKTIFEINNEIRTQHTCSEVDTEKLNLVASLTKLYNVFLLTIVEDTITDDYDKTVFKSNVTTTMSKTMNYVLNFVKIENDLSHGNEKIHAIIYLINELKTKKMTINKYTVIEKFAKKIITKKYISPDQIHKRLENLYELCDDESNQTKIIKMLCL